ncbi:MAG: ATP-binding protein [Patescibacteria group bacterium]
MFALTLVVIVLNLSLGIAILLQGRRDWSAMLFFLITLVFSLLAYVNFNSITTDPAQALWWLRVEMFLAASHTFLFFAFVHIFTRASYPYSLGRSIYFLAPFVLMLALSLTPYIFAGVTYMSASNSSLNAIPGVFFPIFAVWLFVTMALSMYRVVVMFRKSTGLEHLQWKYLLIGSFATYLALVIFNFVLAGIFHNTKLLAYTPLYSLPIVIATAYAIIKHGLFNVKVLATEAFVSIICVVFFARVIISSTTTARVIDVIIFLATAFFGLLLIRSVKQEVKAREEIHKLARQLTETNYQLAVSNEQLKILDQRKSEFVSFVSHQLRSPITVVKGYASMLLEDTYGKLSDNIRAPVEKIFLSSERLVQMVADFLDLSKIEQGKMSYVFTAVDMKALLIDLVEEFATIAASKGLKLILEISEKETFIVTADEGKIRQVISNLLDNAVKYTPKGDVHVSLAKDTAANLVSISIKDTGIGLSHDDIGHIFGKFTRGKDGQKENIAGSGLGLYVAKKMVEAQHGNIRVSSDGPGKGSTFVVELPAEKAGLGVLLPTHKEA